MRVDDDDLSLEIASPKSEAKTGQIIAWIEEVWDSVSLGFFGISIFHFCNFLNENI